MDVGFVLCRRVLDSEDLEQQDVTAQVEAQAETHSSRL
jgi:hypothetical protein